MTSQEYIDHYISELKDWRGEKLAELRKLINSTAPELVEDWKWGVPVWTYNGLVCAISAFTGHIKINFFKGAVLPDPLNLFNSGLDSKDHRSINIGEHEPIPHGIKELVEAAINLNTR